MRQAVFDIETDGLLPELTRVWCAVVRSKDDGERRFDPSTVDKLCDYLSTFDTLVGHNIIAFDLPALRKVFKWEYTGKCIDTLIMSRTQRPKRRIPKACGWRNGGPHSLGVWGWRLGQHKVVYEDWTQFTEEMMHRCAEDVRINEHLLNVLLEEGKGEGWEQCHAMNMVLFRYLQQQEEYGWKVDVPLLKKSIQQLTAWMGRIDSAMLCRLPIIMEIKESKKDGEYMYVKKPFLKSGAYSQSADVFMKNCTFNGTLNGVPVTIGGPFSRIQFRPVNLDANTEVKEFLLKQGWEPAEWNTNNVGEKTSPKLSKEDPFDGIQGSMGRLIARRVQCKQRRGVLEGWLENVREDGRLPTRVAGMAATGRMRHNLVVNVPAHPAFYGRRMRSLFIADEGKVIVGCDSKGNQMRQLAAHMQDEEFTHAVLHGNSDDGTDLHSLNQRRAGLPSRRLAKNFFYGTIFGAQGARVGKIIGKSAKEGAALKDKYFEEMPGLAKLIDKKTAEWKGTAKKMYDAKRQSFKYFDGYIKGIDGRPILVESDHTILVYILQSDESIQMANAYCWLRRELDKKFKWGEDYGIVMWMHDEFQIECKPEIAEEVGRIACESIAWAGRFLKIDCPHDGDVKIGANWHDTH